MHSIYKTRHDILLVNTLHIVNWHNPRVIPSDTQQPILINVLFHFQSISFLEL